MVRASSSDGAKALDPELRGDFRQPLRPGIADRGNFDRIDIARGAERVERKEPDADHGHPELGRDISPPRLLVLIIHHSPCQFVREATK
jgi:hypothetical protein